MTLPQYERTILNVFNDNDKEKFLFNDQNNAELPELVLNIVNLNSLLNILFSLKAFKKKVLRNFVQWLYIK